MKRRQLLRESAVTGLVGLAGFTAYLQVTNQNTNKTPSDSDPDTDSNGDEQPTQPDDPSPPPEEMPVRHGDEFGTVIDAVQAGADPEGNESIGDILKEYADDDTLLSFPAGTYLLPPTELIEYDHLGIAAAHDEHPTFVAPANSCADSLPSLKFDKVSDFLFEGIEFDFRRQGAGGPIQVIASGDATVRDVVVRGNCSQQTGMFRIDIRNIEGTGLVERLRIRNDENSGWMTGAYVGKRHSGEVTFRECELSEFTDNGLYGSAPGTADGGGGVVHTENCHYENNNVANIRLGTARSSSIGDTIVVESAPEIHSVNLRGIRFRRGSDQVVEDCHIRYGPDVTNSFGAVVFHGDSGAARVADTTVTMDSDDISAVKAFHHSKGEGGGPTFENMTVDGDAKRGYAVQVNGRNGTVFRNCTIEQSGDNRDGIRVAYSKDCELVDSRIDVTGYPLILRDTTMTIRNTTFVTPDGERHVDYMEASPGDFRPGEWV